jgi:hypothetical protein
VPGSGLRCAEFMSRALTFSFRSERTSDPRVRCNSRSAG